MATSREGSTTCPRRRRTPAKHRHAASSGAVRRRDRSCLCLRVCSSNTPALRHEGESPPPARSCGQPEVHGGSASSPRYNVWMDNKWMRRGPIFWASILLMEGVFAQNPLGPWVHAIGQGDIYLAVGGNDLDPGDQPTNPVASLDVAIQRADAMLGSFPFLTGVTINVFPGTYTPSGPVSVPAFGVSIEPYRDPASSATAPVVFDQRALTPAFVGAINFDQALGVSAALTGNGSTFYSPSQLRGITILGGVNSMVRIDVAASPSLDPTDIIEVGVHQMTMTGQGTAPLQSPAIAIRNSIPLPNVYRNVIANNTISGFSVGVGIANIIESSDAIIANAIVTTAIGISVNTSGLANDIVRPRILGNFIRGQVNGSGVNLRGGSAHIVGNSIGFVGGSITLTNTPGSIVYEANFDPSIPTLVIANNILFSPGIPAIPEIDVTTFGPFPAGGTLVVDSNSVENLDALPVAPIASVVLTASPFVSPTNLHLAAASVAAVGVGNQALQAPGAAFTIGANSYPTNISMDNDGDSRVHQPAGAGVAVLHRGADQVIGDGIRLRYTTGSQPTDEANAIGAVVPDPSGQSRIAFALDLPAGSFLGMIVSGVGLAGPEFQHAVVPPWGAVALDPATAVIFVSAGPSGTSFNHTANFGDVSAFLEAETYVQALVLRSDGTGTFSNRVRVDFDRR